MTKAPEIEALKDGIRRILINTEGEAVTQRRASQLGIAAETVFIRDDGWSLGCIRNHEPVAAKMWDKNWVTVVKNYGTPQQEVIPYSEFTPTRGNGQPVD